MLHKDSYLYYMVLNMTIHCKNELPFVEKFRPKKLSEVISHKNIIETLKKSIVTLNVPHLLFYGPPGTGKTSTIDAFVNELYGEDNIEFMTMNINASEERGIEVVRNKITNFVKTYPIYTKTDDNKRVPRYKFVILDEADAMTFDAQSTLRKVMEVYTYNARFCLICNYIKGIDDAIKSRCAAFKFCPLQYDEVVPKIKMISKMNGVEITCDGMYLIWKLSNGDMRKLLHFMQVISVGCKRIDANIVSNFQKYPTREDIYKIYETMTTHKFNTAIDTITSIISSKCYAICDVLTELTDIVVELIENNKISTSHGCKILKKMRDVEMNLIVTTDTDIQICALIAIFNLYCNAQKI